MERKERQPGSGKGSKRQLVEKQGFDNKKRLQNGAFCLPKMLLKAEALEKRAEKSKYNEEGTP